MINRNRILYFSPPLQNFGSTPRLVERSADNQFLYYSTHNSIDAKLQHASWVPPQSEVALTLRRFLRLAQEAEDYVPVHNNALAERGGTADADAAATAAAGSRGGQGDRGASGASSGRQAASAAAAANASLAAQLPLSYPPLHYMTINAGEGGRTAWLTKVCDPQCSSPAYTTLYYAYQIPVCTYCLHILYIFYRYVISSKHDPNPHQNTTPPM